MCVCDVPFLCVCLRDARAPPATPNPYSPRPPGNTPQQNFGRPVEWALVKEYAWSAPQLRKLEQPVDAKGQPWAAQQ